jgi:capsular exopolysaccharide synthesis family protein
MAKTRTQEDPVRLVDFDSTRDPLAEAFRMLRLQIEATIDEDSEESIGSTILITSALQSEGKSTIACNLAEVCAIAGISTLLIDTDLRRPVLHKVFQVDRQPGMTDILMDDNPEFVPISPTRINNLSIIPAGRSLKHTTEILGSPAFNRFVDKLRKQFKLIIFDSPPAGIVADAGVLARKVDAVFVVIRSGLTNSRTVEKTVRNLRDLGAKIRGVILSRINPRKSHYYYKHYYPQYYSRYYYDEDGQKKKKSD